MGIPANLGPVSSLASKLIGFGSEASWRDRIKPTATKLTCEQPERAQVPGEIVCGDQRHRNGNEHENGEYHRGA